ncbi:uncharacterized protein TrAFT101_002237 [Trichoderma asperellum]|uniref:uncharacterized protein n=1 Tax=Trichoderma asperellum TaxID=101201 RepID=UPI00333479B5|nr:hypothetical protein TrAFT101_002237 [Trichoderma asperellum]
MYCVLYGYTLGGFGKEQGAGIPIEPSLTSIFPCMTCVELDGFWIRGRQDL